MRPLYRLDLLLRALLDPWHRLYLRYRRHPLDPLFLLHLRCLRHQ